MHPCPCAAGAAGVAVARPLAHFLMASRDGSKKPTTTDVGWAVRWRRVSRGSEREASSSSSSFSHHPRQTAFAGLPPRGDKRRWTTDGRRRKWTADAEAHAREAQGGRERRSARKRREDVARKRKRERTGGREGKKRLLRLSLSLACREREGERESERKRAGRGRARARAGATPLHCRSCHPLSPYLLPQPSLLFHLAPTDPLVKTDGEADKKERRDGGGRTERLLRHHSPPTHRVNTKAGRKRG